MDRFWRDVPINSELFQNLDESVLRNSPTTLENLFINEAGGQSRFPGLKRFLTLPGGGKVYLADWRGDLVAATSNGRVFRIQPSGAFEDVTGAVIAGSGRIVMHSSPDQLLLAAGKQIIQLRKDKTEILSEDAPLSTHAVYISGYVLAIEADSQRFFYSNVGDFTTWDPINFFSSESQPDNLTAMLVNEFSEIILAGPLSVEQFEPYSAADRPFFRRWTLGQGIVAPGVLTAGDNEIWAVNSQQEFVSYAGQNGRPRSLTISMVLESIEDWEGAWASPPMHLFGQKFIILQIPRAPNEYGSRGITLLHDYKAKRWSYLYGWSEENAVPAAWPGNSYHFLRGQHYVGGLNGQIYKLDNAYHQTDGKPQQVRWRSAHFDDIGRMRRTPGGWARIDGVRMRLRRGAASTGYDQDPDFQMRVKRDNRSWSKWQTGKLGSAGDTSMIVYWGQQGNALTWQFEIRCSADCPVEFVRMQVWATLIE